MASQPRTVYVGNVNGSLDEQTIRALFQHCGNVTQVRIAGDPSYNTRYCFVEFSNEMEAMAALSLNGLQLADRQIKVSMAKQGLSPSPAPMGFPGMGYGAMPGMYGFPMPGMQGGSRMPKPQDQEKVARTIHVDNVDYSITEFHLAQFFGVIGTVTAVRIARSPGQVKHKAWVEFQSPAFAQAAFQLDNQVLGSLAIRVTASKSAIHTNGLQITPSMQQQMSAQQTAAPAAAAAPAQPVAASAPTTQPAATPQAEPARAASPTPEEHGRHRRSRSRSPVRHQAEEDKPAEETDKAAEEAAGAADAKEENGGTEDNAAAVAPEGATQE
mmetsp:Transcript_6268/g.17539  ORF Transcript_6268/g.17539 Transcript_6268/m.17539 type:complete len:327 (+) Transcript_6268:289-1269(+)